MAEQSITLAPGESRLVSFEATPQGAKTFQVSVNGLNGSFVALEPVVSLKATGPRNRPQSFWGVWVFDPVAHERKGWRGATMDKQELDLKVESKDFMLISDYYPGWPVGYSMNYGPFKITVPDWGNYTWNAVNNSLGGGGTVQNILSSKSAIVFTPSRYTSYCYSTWAPPAWWYLTAKVVSSTPLSGVDIGKYLIGISMGYWCNLSCVDETYYWLGDRCRQGIPLKGDLSVTAYQYWDEPGVIIIFRIDNVEDI